MKKQFIRRFTALLLSLLVLWTVVISTRGKPFESGKLNLADLSSVYTAILQWELCHFAGSDLLTFYNVLALRQSPFLMQYRNSVTKLMMQTSQDPPSGSADVSGPTSPVANSIPGIRYDDLAFDENGVPSQTVIPTNSQSYTVVNNVYIKNASSRQITEENLAQAPLSAQLASDGPQVLIIHTHGTEAYTMPPGQEYDPSGTYRTLDTNYNVVRVGDEIAAVLSTYGISVLHDRTLHDADSYNDAYNSSYDSIARYLEKYPSITFVLDVHRDAIQDANGNQYKLVTREDSRVAQCCLVMGVAHDNWRDNLQLAIAVQEKLNTLSPTLMRPIAARDYRYNQQFTAGSLLVEIGAAGNSLDEAILGARYFAKGFAETILPAE